MVLGSHCTDLDTDNDLEPSEITLDRVFCNAAPELKTKNVTIAPGSACSAGGSKLILGYDLSKDGNIDEIKSETIICNGNDADAGLNSLIRQVEASTDQCEFGGIVVQTGLDSNKNNLLDDSELVFQTLFVS